MKLRLNRTRWVSLAVVGSLLFSACGLGENKPTEAKITAPVANSVLKVGEQIQIEGLVTGQGITKVEIVIDNVTYASLSAEDKATGVTTFPIESGKIPWTPPAAGPHALQLIVYGAPDDKLLSKSEPVLIQAQAAEVQAPAEPTQPAIVPTVAPPGASPTAAPGGAQPPVPAPAAGSAGGAPSMSVINDFVNVRKGPGVGYDKLGQLDKGQTAPVKGKSSDGEWLQISYPAAANGVGWVKQKDGADTLVQGNDAAKSVPVVAAPPLPVPVAEPVQPAQPAQPPVIIAIGPTAVPPSVATPVPVVPSAATVGGRNVLKVNANPVGSGATVYATWNIPSFKDGEFDKGDGRGFVGPINGVMTVDVPGVTGARTIRLRWRDTGNQQLEDTLILQVAGQAVVLPTTVAVTADCNAANPDWRGNSTAAYTFCVKKDLGWTVGDAPRRSFNVAESVSLTADWNIYGINGIRFVVEPSGYLCAPQGTSVIDVAVNGQGSYTFNVNQLAYGGYIVHLKVTRKDGQQVNYNEKFLCIGNGSGGGGGSSTNTPVPPASTSTPIPDGGGGGVSSTNTPVPEGGGGEPTLTPVP